MQKVRSLSLSHILISTSDILQLDLESIETFCLEFVRLEGSLAEILTRLRSVRDLELVGMPLGSTLGECTFPPSIEHLNLSGSTVNENLSDALQSCTSLREFSLYGTEITNIPVLPAPEMLVNLDISSTKVQSSSISELKRMVNLRVLSLENTGVTLSTVSDLIDITRLEYLDISEFSDLHNGKERVVQTTVLVGPDV
jgi:Leucine-rich repeat (LRR) protein